MSQPPEQPTVRLLHSSPPRSGRRAFADLLFGRRLASSEEEEHRIGPVAGVPVLGLDALASAAYGPEAALTLLLPLGALAVGPMVPITSIIVVLLLVVYFSYRQTIAAYPNGGGSYTVARENLHPRLALLAGAALAVDYVLNVAVGISAGVGALASAVPFLLPHLLPCCLAILALLAVVNLRGTRDTGLTFLVPTYLFVGSVGFVIVLGIERVLVSHGHPVPVMRPPHAPAVLAAGSTWLFVRAFASGCTAMTGVEAVSNGVPLFRQPTIDNAQRSLTLIIAILVGLLLGIAFLCRVYAIGATEPGSSAYESVLSELTRAVVGRGSLYYVTMSSVVAVLCFSANTSFADFPRLCRVLALDRYLPDAFALRGRRLVFSYGVIVLTVLSALLLLAFGGVTDRLIPLFAIGAFLAFTLSQAGMVAHWLGSSEPGRRRSLAINLVGAAATGVTTLVVAVSKFADGAWIVVFALWGLVLGFGRIRRHYENVARAVAADAPLDLSEANPPIVVVPIQSWNRLASRGLRFAVELSADVHALHVLTSDGTISELTTLWEELVAGPARDAKRGVPKLVLRKSNYRQFFGPLIEYVEDLRDAHPDRDIVVVVPELVVEHWYQALLHNNRGTLLRTLLRLRGGPRVIVVNMPFHLGALPEAKDSPPAA
jgi:amino acid transporter